MSSAKKVNPWKHAQRLKHKRKVMGAIRFMEAKKRREAPVKEQNKETKEYIVQMLGWKHENIAVPKKKAAKTAKEDWELGPLRPNRAIGAEVDHYGVVDRALLSRPAVPKHWFGAESKVQKRMKWKIPENVLNNNYPIVKDDRVTVIRGREKGKIGIVKEIMHENNTVIITGVNKAWIDSTLLDRSLPEPLQEFEVPVSYEDVRLVTPFTMYRNIKGRRVKSREDVIVEAIDMQRHTRGKDPFTGEYSYNIPKEHQIDPKTEEVIWHRYVAGTRMPIEWPWEESRQKKEDDARRPGAEEEKSSRDVTKEPKKESILEKVNPLKWLRGNKEKKDDKVTTEATKDEELPEIYDPEQQHRGRPLETEVVDYDDDTPRNIVDDSSFIPYLVYPPHPHTLEAELAQEVSEQKTAEEKAKAEKDEKKLEELRMQRKAEIAQKKLAKKVELEERISSMKTPMQIRWELEQAKKEKYDPRAPQPPSQDLLLALGKHMAAKGVKVQKLPKKKKVQDLEA